MLGMFRNLQREHGFETLKSEGAVPPDLVGTLLRNGPAQSEVFGKPYNHLFDGDGAVSATRIRGGKAEGAVRFIQSAGRIAEQKAQRPMFDTYGTKNAGFWERLRGRGSKNNANTSLLLWQGRLFALMEGAGPTELSPADLSTLGECDLEGVVTLTFSAHPSRIASRHATYNFGVHYGKDPHLNIYALPDVGPASRLARVSLPFLTMVHDFVATERHLIFFISPLRLKLFKFFTGSSFSDSLSWEPARGTEVIIVPIDAPERVTRFTTEPFFQWHFGNAFEQGNNIVVDFARAENFDSNALLGSYIAGLPNRSYPVRYTRATLDLGSGKATFTQLASVSCDFPQVAASHQGKANQFSYAVQLPEEGPMRGLPGGLLKFDVHNGSMQSVTFDNDGLASEALFVPKPGAQAEDEGYLLSVVYDPKVDRSYTAVLDAQNIMAGPQAKLWFDQPIPMTFHGLFQAGI